MSRHCERKRSNPRLGIARSKMDCFVALLPCANASRLSQAKTWMDFQCRISNSQERNAITVIASEAKQSMARHRKIEDGLLRGACHRARICATRWLAMTAEEYHTQLRDIAPHARAICRQFAP